LTAAESPDIKGKIIDKGFGKHKGFGLFPEKEGPAMTGLASVRREYLAAVHGSRPA